MVLSRFVHPPPSWSVAFSGNNLTLYNGRIGLEEFVETEVAEVYLDKLRLRVHADANRPAYRRGRVVADTFGSPFESRLENLLCRCLRTISSRPLKLQRPPGVRRFTATNGSTMEPALLPSSARVSRGTRHRPKKLAEVEPPAVAMVSSYQRHHLGIPGHGHGPVVLPVRGPAGSAPHCQYR